MLGQGEKLRAGQNDGFDGRGQSIGSGLAWLGPCSVRIAGEVTDRMHFGAVDGDDATHAGDGLCGQLEVSRHHHRADSRPAESLDHNGDLVAWRIDNGN